MATKTPLLLCTAYAGEGHFNPVHGIAKYMVESGYEVCFLAENSFRGRVEEAGLEFFSTPAIFTEDTFKRLAERKTTTAPGIGRLAVEIADLIPGTLAGRAARFHEVLETVKARDASREIIIIEDAYSLASMPYRYGKPLPKGFDKIPLSIGIGCTPLLLESQDAGPILSGLPPDSSHSGRLRNKYIHQLVREGPMKYLLDAYAQSMRDCGCTSIPEIKIWNTGYASYDVIFQMCSPSLEFPLSDLPSVIEFAGVLPRVDASPDIDFPEWWPEVTAAKAKGDRQIVFASQGTVNLDYTELLIPTMEAFANRDDTLVLITLGAQGAEFPNGTNIPTNVRVVDYIPYDLILDIADVFVTNGGYGAFTHAVRNGCPVVIAGESQEKAEVVQRAIYAGMGLSLGTQRPSPEQVGNGVQKVSKESKYKCRAIELRTENEDMNALETIKQKIESLRWKGS